MAINVSEHAENSDLMPVLQLAQTCDQSMLNVEQTTVKYYYHHFVTITFISITWEVTI